MNNRIQANFSKYYLLWVYSEPNPRSLVYCPMATSRALSAEVESEGADATLARPLAPEEVRAGDFVAVLHVTYELPSFYWCAESYRIPHNEPVRLQYLPDDAGTPLKVRAVCLPFVLVKMHDGQHRTLDLRKHRLARLDRRFAKIAWKGAKKTVAKPVC
jgi:hypothetical protein